jgi:hypothetical protein
VTTFVEKDWDGITILVDEDLLNRAKELIRIYGITVVRPVAVALETEFNYPPCSSDVSRAMVIASRETAHEREGHIRPVSRATTVIGMQELQCLCRTQYHCEKHCMAGDHV